MPTWVVVYGVAVSLSSMGAVLMMGRITKRQRREMAMMHKALLTAVCGASNMWDTLTPEQIRSLHPNTVEVANGLPPWREVQEWFNDARFQMKVERVDD